MGRSGALPPGFLGPSSPRNAFRETNVLLTGTVALIGAMVLSFEQGVGIAELSALACLHGCEHIGIGAILLSRSAQALVQFRVPGTGFSDLRDVVAESELARQSVGNRMDGHRVSLRALITTRGFQAGARELGHSGW